MISMILSKKLKRISSLITINLYLLYRQISSPSISMRLHNFFRIMVYPFISNQKPIPLESHSIRTSSLSLTIKMVQKLLEGNSTCQSLLLLGIQKLVLIKKISTVNMPKMSYNHIRSLPKQKVTNQFQSYKER